MKFHQAVDGMIEVSQLAELRYEARHQRLKTVEECAELIVALMHYDQDRGTRAAVNEEAADVLFTIIHLFTQSPEPFIDFMQLKTDRLRGRLSGE